MVVVADSYGEKLAKIPMQDDNGDDGCEQEEAVSCKDGCEYDCCEHKHIHDCVHSSVYGPEEEQEIVDTSHGIYIS